MPRAFDERSANPAQRGRSDESERILRSILDVHFAPLRGKAKDPLEAALYIGIQGTEESRREPLCTGATCVGSVHQSRSAFRGVCTVSTRCYGSQERHACVCILRKSFRVLNDEDGPRHVQRESSSDHKSLLIARWTCRESIP